MPVLEREVMVEAPAELCFDIVQAERIQEWLIGLEEIFDIEGEPGTDRRFKWRYRMAGIPFSGVCIVDQYDRPHSYGDFAPSAIPFTFRSTYTRVGDQTKVQFKLEYQVPGKLLHKLASCGFIDRINGRKLEASMEILRQIAEREAVLSGQRSDLGESASAADSPQPTRGASSA